MRPYLNALRSTLHFLIEVGERDKVTFHDVQILIAEEGPSRNPPVNIVCINGRSISSSS
jgi:hypothetical protein